MHYGQPTEFQREAYTRVLMGAIELADLIVSSNTADVQVSLLTLCSADGGVPSETSCHRLPAFIGLISD